MFEKECLFGPTQNGSNTRPNDQSYPPGCIGDKDVLSKRAREKKTPKEKYNISEGKLLPLH